MISGDDAGRQTILDPVHREGPPPIGDNSDLPDVSSLHDQLHRVTVRRASNPSAKAIPTSRLPAPSGISRAGAGSPGPRMAFG